MNVLKNHAFGAVLTLLDKKTPLRQIVRLTGIDRNTVRSIARGTHRHSNSPGVAPGSAESAGQIHPPRPPGGAAATEKQTPPPSRRPPEHARSACEPYREFIEAEVEKGRLATAIYQDLVDHHGFRHRYNSVKRFVRALRHREPERFERLEFMPGEEAQVDYGLGALTRHPETGKLRRPRLFVMTLRFSGRAFRKVVWKSSRETWCRLHEEAFRYFGGVPQYVVLDNLKEGVLSPDVYEPELNPLYAQMLAHYGVVGDPARIRDPNRKGAVESAIQHTQRTALHGREFESIEDQNTFLMDWEERWAKTRVHGRTKRQVEEVFQQERPFLRPLPHGLFRYFRQEPRIVADDGLIQVGQSYYAALPARIGSEVWVRIYDLELEVLEPRSMTVIRRHPIATRRGQVVMEERDRIYQPSRDTKRLLDQAARIGPQTGVFCRQLFETQGRVAQKRIRGILSLTRRFPAWRIEQVVAQALNRGATSSSRLIRQILEREEERAPSNTPQLELLQEHELSRPMAEYQDLWDAWTGAPQTTPTQNGDESVCP